VVGCFHDATASVITAMHGYMMGPKGATSFYYPPGAPYAMHYSATPDGRTIVGAYLAGANQPDNWHGYVLNDARVIPFDFPGKVGTQALGISPAREVVGVYKVLVDKTWNAHGFVAETRGSVTPADWKFTAVDLPGATQTIVRAINDGGDLVGYYVDASGVTHGFIAKAAAPSSAGTPASPGSASPAPLPPSTGTGSGVLEQSRDSRWSVGGPLVLVLAGAAALAGLALRKKPR